VEKYGRARQVLDDNGACALHAG